jgi:hypothetical protein
MEVFKAGISHPDSFFSIIRIPVTPACLKPLDFLKNLPLMFKSRHALPS